VTRPKLLLDCDPGHDDAIAMLCAARYGDLVGITTVSGNAPLDRTTTNALLVSQIAEIDVEVHSGSERPLMADPVHAHHVHGPSGLDGPELPPLQRAVASRDAVEFLLDRAADDVWLVPTGPLTNIALALRRDPALLTRFAGITLMGGSVTGGNATPVAEFNIWADPEAAAEVFATGNPLTMIGLDLTHQVRMGHQEAVRLREADTATARMVADILDFYAASTPGARAAGAAAMHDPCAVLQVTHPELFESIRLPVAVETRGRYTRGMTVVDSRVPRSSSDRADGPFNDQVQVARHAEAARVIDLIIEAAVVPIP